MSDRRENADLNAAFDYEVPDLCIQSVIEIRQFLPSELQALEDDKQIAQGLRASTASMSRTISQRSFPRQGSAHNGA